MWDIKNNVIFGFQDPVIQSAVTTNANNPTLDDYNPFDNKTAPKAVDPSPAVMNPTEEPVPTPKPQISTAEFQVCRKELFHFRIFCDVIDVKIYSSSLTAN